MSAIYVSKHAIKRVIERDIEPCVLDAVLESIDHMAKYITKPCTVERRGIVVQLAPPDKPGHRPAVTTAWRSGSLW
jgi:hypothetical protein